MTRLRQSVRLPIYDHLLAVGFYLVAGRMTLEVAEQLLLHPDQLNVGTGTLGLVAVVMIAVLMAMMTRPRPATPTTAVALFSKVKTLVPRRAAALAFGGVILSSLEPSGFFDVVAYLLTAGALWADTFLFAYRKS